MQCFDDTLYYLGLGENHSKLAFTSLLPLINSGLQLNKELAKLFYFLACPYSIILKDPHLKCYSILTSIPNSLVVQIIDPNLKQKIKFGIDNNKRLIIIVPNLSSLPQDVLLLDDPITIYCSCIDTPVQNFAVVAFDSSEFTIAADPTWKLEYKCYLETIETLSDFDAALSGKLGIFQDTKEEEHISDLLLALNRYEATFAALVAKETKLLKLDFTCLFSNENQSLVRFHSDLPGLYSMNASLIKTEFYQMSIEGILKLSLLPADQLLFYTNQYTDIYSVLKHVLSCGIVFIFSQGDSSFQFAKEIYPELKRCNIKNEVKEMAVYYNMLNLSNSELLQLYFKLLHSKSTNFIIDIPVNELSSCPAIVNQILRLGYKVSSLVSLDLGKVICKNLELDLAMERKTEFLIFHSVVCFLIELKLILLYPQYWIDNLISIVDKCSGDLKETLHTFYFTNLRHLNEKIVCGHIFEYIKHEIASRPLDVAIGRICATFQECDKFKFHETDFNSPAGSVDSVNIHEFSKLQLLEDLSLEERKHWMSANLIEMHHMSIPSNLVYFFDNDSMYIDGIPVLNLSKTKEEGSIAISGIQIKNAWLTIDGLIYAQSRQSQSGFISKCKIFKYLVPLFKDNVLYLYFNCSVADELLSIKIVRIDV